MATRTFKCVCFFGSARDQAAPWGGPARLGDRVLKFMQLKIAAHNAVETNDKLDVEVFDTLAMPEFQTVMRNPAYFMKEVPAILKAAQDKVEAADCYIVLTPEYNHTMPSALTNMMNFFGGSKYGYKPSGCVCYSGTPIGGPRVASALRPYLSELGCLPISKQVIFTSAANTFNEDGSLLPGHEHQDSQFAKFMDQLIWWTQATATQRATHGLPK